MAEFKLIPPITAPNNVNGIPVIKTKTVPIGEILIASDYSGALCIYWGEGRDWPSTPALELTPTLIDEMPAKLNRVINALREIGAIANG